MARVPVLGLSSRVMVTSKAPILRPPLIPQMYAHPSGGVRANGQEPTDLDVYGLSFITRALAALEGRGSSLYSEENVQCRKMLAGGGVCNLQSNSSNGEYRGHTHVFAAKKHA